jgi:hypothetical protein
VGNAISSLFNALKKGKYGGGVGVWPWAGSQSYKGGNDNRAREADEQSNRNALQL